MKHLLTVSVILGLALSANAALLTEDFADISDWSQTSEYGGGAITVVGGAGHWDGDGEIELLTRTVAFGAQSTLVVSYDQQSYAGSWIPGVLHLGDAGGDSIVLDLAISKDVYFSRGYGVAAGSIGAFSVGGISSYNDVFVADTDVWKSTTYTITGIGTAAGAITVGAQSWSGIDLSAIGAITTVEFHAKKNMEIDNLNIDIPEPASLVLLGLGGLGALIRRRR